ncbi:sister chromatid cohesion 1 protein 3-like [Tripterygium wilfordii]|uniref:sister chromatid cohesion 1 protein 3-like n=1 Tax=Tripterygium wilfordii TaxID=458696 RepID=UPI0018F8182F|nr:sister chromatid cohesion 1 protein 3-like [Tripterygium wilfordii]
MFYSQTFLGRKGPLATVWCAAHVQHRLKKSHYTSTDISSTVDKIMFPEVPIALRMSGHLLFGVVRIYSKKVDYLYQDCNVIVSALRKAFSSIDVNLPEDARQAPIQSITLPDTFDLDCVNLDDDILTEGYPDSHIKSQEDITLMDQIPAGINPYIVISFDEDMMMDATFPEEGHTGIGTTEGPTFSPVNGSMGFQDLDPRNLSKEHSATQDVQDPGPINQTEILNARVIGDGSPQNFPDIEVLRDTVHSFDGESLPQMYADEGNVVAMENRSSGDIRNENETLSPIMHDMIPSRGQSLPSQQCSEPTTSAASLQAPEIFEAHVSVGNMPVDFAIRSTPPARQPQLRRRKRKFFFDETIVLSNRFLKKTLEDSSDLLRKKRESPCSALDIWKKKNILRKEEVFNDPLVTGLCTDICNIFSKENFSSRPHLLLEEETIPEPSVPNSPARGAEATTEPRVVLSAGLVTEATRDREPSPPFVPEMDRDIELMRDFDGHIGGDDLFPKDAYVPFPFRNVDSTPTPSNNSGLESMPLAETIPRSGMPPTPSVAASTGNYGSEPETPRTFVVEGLGVESTGLSDIPETMNSAEANELYFLEADYNIPPGSQETQLGDDLLPRTRAVFQYLERHSPSNPMLEDTPGDLSLNKILEGRTRKLCARMFYETLVLKNKQVVDVLQEEPYGDITLTLKSPPKTDP